MNISNNQKWFIIISAIVLSFILVIALIPTNKSDCPECNCQEQTCEYTREDMVSLCEITNKAIDLSNQQIDYINEFANPTDIILKKQDYLMCSIL